MTILLIKEINAMQDFTKLKVWKKVHIFAIHSYIALRAMVRTILFDRISSLRQQTTEKNVLTYSRTAIKQA